jgi:hypothetical protein
MVAQSPIEMRMSQFSRKSAQDGDVLLVDAAALDQAHRAALREVLEVVDR